MAEFDPVSYSKANKVAAQMAEKANQADLIALETRVDTIIDSNSLKVAKIEKDLNDYQQTMAGVNVNQEPTQQATGYGIVSLPKNAANGQVSVSVFGNTETDEEGNTKSTISAMRIRSVSSDETQQSEIYIPNIGELRSLPNGVKDEIRVSAGKVIQRLGQLVITGDLDFGQLLDTTNTYRMRVVDWVLDKNILQSKSKSGVGYSLDGDYSIRSDTPAGGVSGKYIAFSSNNLYIYIEKTKIDAMAGSDTAAKFKAYLNQYPITLIYQLATPIEIPIQTSGALVSYPSGTVYIEPFVADAGIYTDKMSVLHQDLPIKAIEKLSKVDFITGLETELDVSETVIAGDKLSFTHPDLEAGDIVFFVYEYDRESTVGETEISYYDSRYVIKGEDDKFYQWEIEAKLVEGVITPSIKLVEV